MNAQKHCFLGVLCRRSDQLKKAASRITVILVLALAIFAIMPSVQGQAGEPSATTLGETGASSSANSSTTTASVGNLNKAILNLIVGAGVIVTALGAIKLIISLSDHSPMGKMSASTTVGLGLVLIGGSSILDTLQPIIDTASTPEAQVDAVIDFITDAFFWPGVILVVVSLVKMILAFAEERPEGKMDSSKMMAAGLGIMSLSYILKGISAVAFKDDAAVEITKFIINDVIFPMGFLIGIPLMLFGVLQFASAFKEEDAAGKHRATIMMITALMLTSIGSVLKIFT